MSFKIWSTYLKTREKVQNLLFGVNFEFPHIKKVSFLFVFFFFILGLYTVNWCALRWLEFSKHYDYLQRLFSNLIEMAMRALWVIDK